MLEVLEGTCLTSGSKRRCRFPVAPYLGLAVNVEGACPKRRRFLFLANHLPLQLDDHRSSLGLSAPSGGGSSHLPASSCPGERVLCTCKTEDPTSGGVVSLSRSRNVFYYG